MAEWQSDKSVMQIFKKSDTATQRHGDNLISGLVG